MPPKNPTAAQRRAAALTICKTLSNELSVVAKPLSRVNIKNIPDSVEPAIRAWIKKHAGKHEVYGSAAAATHRIGGRRPGDLDIIVGDPRTAANAVVAIMRRKKIKCQIVERKVGGGLVIKILKNGRGVEAVDFHPPKGHAGKYELYGQTKPPLVKNGITIQRASDQMLRKANEITKKQPDGSTGAAPHRNLKDTRDFIETSKTLLASLELKSKADQQRAKRVRTAIKVWERHLKTLAGAPKPPKRKAISKTRAKRFEQKARANPVPDVDNLIFEDSTPRVVERKGQKGGVPGGMLGAGEGYASGGYAGSGYAGDPYGAGQARDPYGDRQTARSPYSSQPEPRPAALPPILIQIPEPKKRAAGNAAKPKRRTAAKTKPQRSGHGDTVKRKLTAAQQRTLKNKGAVEVTIQSGGKVYHKTVRRKNVRAGTWEYYLRSDNHYAPALRDYKRDYAQHKTGGTRYRIRGRGMDRT